MGDFRQFCIVFTITVTITTVLVRIGWLTSTYGDLAAIFGAGVIFGCSWVAAFGKRAL